MTAEQLAPYLDVQPDDLERVDGQVNEDFVVSSCLMNPEQLDDYLSPCHCTAHSYRNGRHEDCTSLRERFANPQVPALIQFEGHPEVSETGDLVYIFPGLQRTARQQVRAAHSSSRIFFLPILHASYRESAMRLHRKPDHVSYC